MFHQISQWVCYIFIGFGLADLTAGLDIDYPGIKYWRFLKKYFNNSFDFILIILGIVGLLIIK